MRRALAVVAVLGGAALALVRPPVAGAAVIVVDTIVDTAGGPGCSLRDAIVAANSNEAWGGCTAGNGDDVIDVTGLSGTIELFATLPTIAGWGEATVVRGPGADRLAISGLDSHPVFATEELIISGMVVIEGLTVRDGSPTCILAGGFLTVRDARVTSCVGSGIDMGLLGFLLTVERSLLDDNTGGWAIRTGGTAGSGGLHLLSSTVSGNDSGVLIQNNEGMGMNRIHSSTLADNRSVNLLVQHDQFVRIEHTILKHYPGRPRRDPPGVNCRIAETQSLPPGARTVFSLASLDDDGSCALAGPGDLEPTDPRLGPLADNGGPTATHAPLPDSPVLDAGEVACTGPEGDLVLDQRGRPRPLPSGPGLPARCDLGAVEFSPQEVPEPVSGAARAAVLALAALARGRRGAGAAPAVRATGAHRVAGNSLRGAAKTPSEVISQ